MRVVIFFILLYIFPVTYAQDYSEYGVSVETVAENLTIPWSIDWISDKVILFTERNGNLRIIEEGQLREEPLLTIDVGGWREDC